MIIRAVFQDYFKVPDVTAGKVSKYGVFLVLFSCMRRLNTEIHSVNLRIQSEYRETRTRKNAVFGHFSRRVCFSGNSTTTCYSLQIFATLHDLNRNFMKGIFYRYTSSF